MKPLAVVCLSGGMDSCVAAALAAQEHRLAALFARYGQRTQRREQACFEALAAHYAAERTLIVDFPHLQAIGGSSLTDRSLAVREGEPEPDRIPTSYVPFRNAHLLSAATAWAEVLGAQAVSIGAVWEDSSGYPDCRPEFYQAFQQVIDRGTRPEARIRIVTPVIRMTKGEIVRRGLALGAPFQKTWSCYQGDTMACGGCESCRLRLRAFAAAGVADPIPYEVSQA